MIIAGTQTSSHTMGIQVGVDMYANESWKAGMYTSILDIDSNVKRTKTGSDGKGGNIDDNAFYVGGYATWFSGDGMYVRITSRSTVTTATLPGGDR